MTTGRAYEYLAMADAVLYAIAAALAKHRVARTNATSQSPSLAG